MRYKRGTNQYKKKTYTKEWLAIFGFCIFMAYSFKLIYEDMSGKIVKTFANEIVSPLPDRDMIRVEVPVYFPEQNQDTWIREYAEKYANRQKPVSYLKYQLHCLANKESGHHANKGTGDHGLALGLYQYHQSTWVGFRKIMMTEGLITEIGDRTNDEQAIETTAWALADGRDQNWGPWLRGECH